jgi:isopentenyl diphosphate isomerase/L-lactate dehydrogenase-like FMN-dependent dehydrogenase
VTEEVIARLAEVSGLPVVVKGVLRGDDALPCVEAGAAGVIVSTHVGRQLDRALPSAFALPDFVDAVGAGCRGWSTGVCAAASRLSSRWPSLPTPCSSPISGR